MTRFTVTIQCFRTDGGIVVGGEDVDGLDDNVGHWLVKGGGGSETGRGESWSREMGRSIGA